jgi:hypothetical protein
MSLFSLVLVLLIGLELIETVKVRADRRVANSPPFSAAEAFITARPTYSP